MKISRGRDSSSFSLHQQQNFSGEVWADPVVIDVDGVSMHHVFFAPRGRTHWHTHEVGQLLHVTSGSGFVFSKVGGRAAIRAGDTVWIEPGEVHWHGAGEDAFLVHIAISLGGHEWLDPVTEEEYEES
jgi:quercetin dioxygenase-like cupin family protein